MTSNEKMMLKVLKKLIRLKKRAENDPCYSLNVGIHTNAINAAFDDANKVVSKVTHG